MKTIIVPVDFSHASVNAAEYASQMAGHTRADKIVLYHTYGGSTRSWMPVPRLFVLKSTPSYNIFQTP